MFDEGANQRRSDGATAATSPAGSSLQLSVSSAPSSGATETQMAHTPGAGAGHGAIEAAALVPAELLDGGEIIIFAVKPSLWFILLESARLLLAMLVVILLAHYIGDDLLGIHEAKVIQGAVAIGGLRVGLALLLWVSRLYILTNRRIMRLTGIFNIDLFECQLTRIQNTALTMAWYERIFGIGTISFATAGAGGGFEASWVNVNQPLELHERVRAAINRAQRPGNGV